MGLLDGKIAIVTGAGAGLGRAHALELARHGARVVVNDIGVALDGSDTGERPAEAVANEINAAGGEAVANFDNIASFAGAESLVTQAIEEWGQLDIVVNNAGILRDRMSWNISEEDWDAVINVHLKGHFAPSHFAARHWRARSKAGEAVSGRIINTSSEAGLYGNVGQSNYSAAKAGIAALTITMGRELSRIGVTVNAISPRALTRMTENLMGPLANVGDGEWSAVAPENVSPLVAWLASDEAGHVSGQNFVVWGDSIELASGWKVVEQVQAGGRAWQAEELTDAMKQLFAEHDPSVPPFGAAAPAVQQ